MSSLLELDVGLVALGLLRLGLHGRLLRHGLALRNRRDLRDVLRPHARRASRGLGDLLAVADDRVEPPDVLEREGRVLLDDLVHSPAEVDAPPLAPLQSDLLLLRVPGTILKDLGVAKDAADRADPLRSAVVPHGGGDPTGHGRADLEPAHRALAADRGVLVPDPATAAHHDVLAVDRDADRDLLDVAHELALGVEQLTERAQDRVLRDEGIWHLCSPTGP